MATLSDAQIRAYIYALEELKIEPLVDENIEPASVDLRLSNEFAKISTAEGYEYIDTEDPDSMDVREWTDDSIVLAPGESVLGSTVERISIPANLEGEVTGRSSLARLFVVVHNTAGFCDPGWSGRVTLEITNHSQEAVKLYAGQRVCQIIFRELTSPAEKPYGHERSQYQNQDGTTASGMNFR